MSSEGLAPHVKYSLAKYVDKGEDAWTQQPELKCTLPGSEDEHEVALFGVFDGHGGKQAAVYASRHLHTHLQTALRQPGIASPADEGSDAAADSSNAGEAAAELRIQVQTLGAAPEDVAACDDADRVAAALPLALVAAFAATEQAFINHSQESGTTATVAAVVGWTVVVANVGDSLAYLDTGSEVVQVSGNHRLDDSKAEQERVIAAGAEVAQSEVDGKPVGPLRVWPGGLAMGRTIGDASAGTVVSCEPEARQVVLPRGGGRLLLASDGLWDSVAPKTALHHVRGLPASKAAAELVNMCQRGKKPRDDITALVIDAIPPDSPDAKLPPLLAARAGGRGGHANGAAHDAEPVDIRWPLTGEGNKHWRSDVWRRRLAVAQAQQQAAEAAAAESKAAAARAAAEDEAAVQRAVADAAADASGEESAAYVSAGDGGGSDVDSDDGSGAGEVQYASELHRQMAALQGDPSELEEAAQRQLEELKEQGKQQQRELQQLKQQQEAEAAAEWKEVPVKPRRQEADAFRELAVPGSNAQVQQGRASQQYGRGHGAYGGRGRDGRGGRGRGRQHVHPQQQQQQHQQQQGGQQPEQQAADASGDHQLDPAAARAPDADVAGSKQPAADSGEVMGAANPAASAQPNAAPQQPASQGVSSSQGRGRGRQQGRGRSWRAGMQDSQTYARGGYRGGGRGVHQQDNMRSVHGRGQGNQRAPQQGEAPAAPGRGRGRRGAFDMAQGRGRGRGRQAPHAQQQQQQQQPVHVADSGGSQPGRQQQREHPQQEQQTAQQPQPKPVRSTSISAQQLFDAMRAASQADDAAGSSSSATANGVPSSNSKTEHTNGFVPHAHQRQPAQQQERRAEVSQLQFGSYTIDSAPSPAPPPPQPQQHQQRLQFGTMDFGSQATPLGPPQHAGHHHGNGSNAQAQPYQQQQHQQQQHHHRNNHHRHHQQQPIAPEPVRQAAQESMQPGMQDVGADGLQQQKAAPQYRAYDPVGAQRGGGPGRGRGRRYGSRPGGPGGRGAAFARARSHGAANGVLDAATAPQSQSQPDDAHKRG